MPLSATESITLCADLKISVAFALSPATTAFWTFLITVRNFERSAVFAAFSLTSWRARLRPEAMRTVFFLALEEVAMLELQSRWVPRKQIAHGAKTASIAPLGNSGQMATAKR